MPTKDELIQNVKNIVKMLRDKRPDEAYAAYGELFSKPDFAEHRPEDQRSVLRLMITTNKGIPDPGRSSSAQIEAYRVAAGALAELLSKHADPGDHELLGLCHLMLGDTKAASDVFRAGLALERQRNPQSDLCGTLMKLISFT